MSTTCFVTYEIHPTTWGGCGVLLRHAAEHLLNAGGEVVFLLDIPEHECRKFAEKDKHVLPNAERVRVYHADTLCADCELAQDEAPGANAWKSVRFAHAVEKVLGLEPKIDFVEFFEYCGVGYYTMMRRLFGRGEIAERRGVVLGTRLHNSLELIDDYGASRFLDRERYQLYSLERAGLHFSEAVLTPTRAYFERYYRDRYRLPESQVVVSQSPKVVKPTRTRMPGADEPFTIAYVGRMFAFKGVDQLVRAGVELFRKRPRLKAVIEIIGPDASESPLGSSYAEYLRSLVPGPMRERFRFTGHLSHEQIVDRLGDAMFAVFPNKLESFCYALHETYDAGVPVVINDLPGFADFFRHEKNCLVYDGRTDTLLAAMERMIDDASLRERLTRPYPVAIDPLGKFYAQPRALRPLTGAARWVETLVVVLDDGAGDPGATLGALRAGDAKPGRIVRLLATDPNAEETFWWLGRPWHARDEHGKPIAGADILSLDALVILAAGDEPGREWLSSCERALGRDESLGFAATWGRTKSAPTNGTGSEAPGRIVPSRVDLAPEAYPFEHGTRRTRALIRTLRGMQLADVLDQNLAQLGEVGLIWGAVEKYGPGAALDAPLIQVRDEAAGAGADPADSSLLKYLLAKYGRVFADRLTLYTAHVDDRLRAVAAQSRELAAKANIPLPAPAPGAVHIEPSLEYRIRMADELGGTLLARMAFRKMQRRLLGKAPPRGRG